MLRQTTLYIASAQSSLDTAKTTEMSSKQMVKTSGHTAEKIKIV